MAKIQVFIAERTSIAEVAHCSDDFPLGERCHNYVFIEVFFANETPIMY